MDKIITFDNLSNYHSNIQTVIDDKVNELITNTEIKFFCVEPVTIIINGESQIYPGNTLVDKFIKIEDEFEIVTTSDTSIKALYAWPGALGTYYEWLEGVSLFDGILFDMNSTDMYTKWNQGNQGLYRVQFAQYKNCIFWSDNAYISDVALRTNYTLYNSSELPLCYSTIPDNTFKSFYFAYNVTCDPNWSNPAYKESFSKATWATQVFSYYGLHSIGLFDMDSSRFNITLPKDCRGLMFYAPNVLNAGIFDAINVTNFGAKSGSWRDAFAYCYQLTNLYIKNLKVNLNISWSPVNQQSLEFILSNAANTSKITIYLSPHTYYGLTDANKTLATEKNIVLSLIDTNTSEDVRLHMLQMTGDGNSYLANDGTYKALSIPTKVSDLENDIKYLTDDIENPFVKKSDLLVNSSLMLRAYIFNVNGTYTKTELEELLHVSLNTLIIAMSNGVPLTIFSKDATTANISQVIESNYTLTDSGELNTLTLYWHQYELWCTTTVTLKSDGNYNVSFSND